jgi:hypothetical protein
LEKGIMKISSAIRNYYSYMNQIVTMPDFFLDRILMLESQNEFFQSMVNKIRAGGGRIRGITKVDRK